MSKDKNVKIYTQNRELSWLKFNERVLDEADDTNVPLMERLKFISIFSSNLDEFFMIRVGSLFDLSIIDNSFKDKKSGWTAKEQLERIYQEVKVLYEKKDKIYAKVTKELGDYDIFSLEYKDLSKTEDEYIKTYYENNISPVLSPQIVDVHHPFPFMPSKSIFVVTRLKRDKNEVVGLIQLPESLPEIIVLPGNTLRYIKTEKVIYHLAEKVFTQYSIEEKNIISVTRNADIRFEDEAFDMDEDFRERMATLLHKRKRLCVIRLESRYTPSAKTIKYMCSKLHIEPEQIFVTKSDLKMSYIFSLFSKLSLGQNRQLTYPPYTPVLSTDNRNNSLMSQVKKRDMFLFYPFQSMTSFLKLIKEAAYDPKVMSIKITIYRLAKKSKLVDYLCAAAENGKDVTAVMELRARFDEHNNIDWSEKLEDAGCRVLYGIENYKVHSKVCLITYRDKNSVSYITQIGTGNYNEKTAELYTDFSLITSDSKIGKDAVELFKNLSIGNTDGMYQSLLVAPSQLKNPLLKLIDREIKKGEEGRIIFKMNSLTDIDFIDKLVEASKAGVKIDIYVRGICCILPEIKGETENIHITSIVGRYLEHSRIYSFGEEDDQLIYIASADLMTRNTENRIEVACPINSREVRNKINQILEIISKDNIKARVLQSDGSYKRKINNSVPMDSQLYFMQSYQQESGNKEKISTVVENKVGRYITRIINNFIKQK